MNSLHHPSGMSPLWSAPSSAPHTPRGTRAVPSVMSSPGTPHRTREAGESTPRSKVTTLTPMNPGSSSPVRTTPGSSSPVRTTTARALIPPLNLIASPEKLAVDSFDAQKDGEKGGADRKAKELATKDHSIDKLAADIASLSEELRQEKAAKKSLLFELSALKCLAETQALEEAQKQARIKQEDLERLQKQVAALEDAAEKDAFTSRNYTQKLRSEVETLRLKAAAADKAEREVLALQGDRAEKLLAKEELEKCQQELVILQKSYSREIDGLRKAHSAELKTAKQEAQEAAEVEIVKIRSHAAHEISTLRMKAVAAENHASLRVCRLDAEVAALRDETAAETAAKLLAHEKLDKCQKELAAVKAQFAREIEDLRKTPKNLRVSADKLDQCLRELEDLRKAYSAALQAAEEDKTFVRGKEKQIVEIQKVQQVGMVRRQNETRKLELEALANAKDDMELDCNLADQATPRKQTRSFSPYVALFVVCLLASYLLWGYHGPGSSYDKASLAYARAGLLYTNIFSRGGSHSCKGTCTNGE